MLNEALSRARRLATHDYLVAVFSDFDGVDAETRRLVTLLARHNDVIAVSVYDPSATRIPDRGRLVVSDGELQVELDVGQESVRKKMLEFSDRRLGEIMRWQAELGVGVLPLTTAEEPVAQVRRLLGNIPRPRRG